ncbi:hypothetical protein PEDI_24070 [Persicobacter diffluens]|uniref:Uncharacterized protein n=1 Tax=Persicobacter diffluens TaxID=981 RepID=A0AAN5AJP3_9BACT|nr:hypothetical protein PEDI_24070 [Persicobacter diffluens]
MNDPGAICTSSPLPGEGMKAAAKPVVGAPLRRAGIGGFQENCPPERATAASPPSACEGPKKNATPHEVTPIKI